MRIGIDRKIKQAWLDGVLDRLAQGADQADLRSYLEQSLRPELPGNASRANTIGILLRIWCGVPLPQLAVRERALALLPKVTREERLWLHWGMTALAYPFFRSVAEVIGRLFVLQDEVRTGQVYSRLVSDWGDRETSKEAAQKLLRTLVDWGALHEAGRKGRFHRSAPVKAGSTELQTWLLDALFNASGAAEIEAQQLLRLPEAFPFGLTISIGDLRKHQGFDIHRQGLDMDMVALRKTEAKRPAPKRRNAAREKITISLFDNLGE